MSGPQRDYGAFYDRITKRLRRSGRAVQGMTVLNRILTVIVYGSYVCILLNRILAGWRTGGAVGAAAFCAPYVLVPGISFLLVSLVREWINEKRPYETWDIRPLIHKETKGHSMPSRHIFSTTVIAMCALDLSLSFGVLLLLVSAAFSVLRVLGGVHYPKDVAVGFAVGVLAGVILLIL